MTGCLTIILTTFIAIGGSVAIGCKFGEEAGWNTFGLFLLVIAVLAMIENGKTEEDRP